MVKEPRRHARENGCQFNYHVPNMKPARPEPNAELHQRFEPLRVTFALLALLLGAIASMQF